MYLYATTFTKIIGNQASDNDSSGISTYGACEGNVVVGNICNNNISKGISVNGKNCVVSENVCCGNNVGIAANTSGNSSFVGNTCSDNTIGIAPGNSINVCFSTAIVGNTCIRGTGLASDYTSEQYTIYIEPPPGSRTDFVMNNLFANNILLGKNYVDNSNNTTNTFVNNKYN